MGHACITVQTLLNTGFHLGQRVLSSKATGHSSSSSRNRSLRTWRVCSCADPCLTIRKRPGLDKSTTVDPSRDAEVAAEEGEEEEGGFADDLARFIGTASSPSSSTSSAPIWPPSTIRSILGQRYSNSWTLRVLWVAEALAEVRAKGLSRQRHRSRTKSWSGIRIPIDETPGFRSGFNSGRRSNKRVTGPEI